MSAVAGGPIIVTGNNVEVTSAMSEYVNKKLGTVVGRHQNIVTKCDVHLSVIHNPRVKLSHCAEVTVSVKGLVMRTSERSENMYASIDMVADGLARKLRKFKERKKAVSHESAFKMTIDEEEEEEEFLDEEENVDMYDTSAELMVNMDIVKEKTFNMEPISVADAVLCLEYIDHDFYVFRNKDSGEVNVVYKRNHGGVGHIAPGDE
jgi:putative sigma-54 modulation protein